MFKEKIISVLYKYLSNRNRKYFLAFSIRLALCYYQNQTKTVKEK